MGGGRTDKSGLSLCLSHGLEPSDSRAAICLVRRHRESLSSAPTRGKRDVSVACPSCLSVLVFGDRQSWTGRGGRTNQGRKEAVCFLTGPPLKTYKTTTRDKTHKKAFCDLWQFTPLAPLRWGPGVLSYTSRRPLAKPSKTMKPSTCYHQPRVIMHIVEKGFIRLLKERGLAKWALEALAQCWFWGLFNFAETTLSHEAEFVLDFVLCFCHVRRSPPSLWFIALLTPERHYRQHFSVCVFSVFFVSSVVLCYFHSLHWTNGFGYTIQHKYSSEETVYVSQMVTARVDYALDFIQWLKQQHC